MNHPVVLITGALTGIGRATALAFAKDGARIVIAGRRDEAGEESVTELRTLGAEAEYWRTDVRHEDDVRSWSIRPFPALVASMWRSTTPGPKASPVR
jgi:NAD(P)-dependent dehydrogenase (short-subunit alcohol dehydrogenase family)